MRLSALLAGLIAVGIVVWGIVAVLGLPGAFDVSGGASMTLGLLVLAMVAVLGAGASRTGATRTAYW
ncbi:MAG: hypothetical protein ABEJ76_08715 [Halanaeroarchaeum sp.]